jgi:hypothetical protein
MRSAPPVTARAPAKARAGPTCRLTSGSDSAHHDLAGARLLGAAANRPRSGITVVLPRSLGGRRMASGGWVLGATSSRSESRGDAFVM